jgi:cytochrome P450
MRGERVTTSIRSTGSPVPIPGPTGSALLGMAQPLRRDMLGTLLENFHTYGDLVSYHFGPRWGPRWMHGDGVGVHHPDAVRHVLTNGRQFTRRSAWFTVLREMLGDGLLTSDGDVWVRQRRTLQPLFTPRRVAGYEQLMSTEAARIVAEPGVSADGVTDLHHLMQRYTLRVVGRALFGDEVDDVVGQLQRLVPQIGEISFIRAMQLGRLPLGLPSPRNRRFTRARDEQYAIVDRIVARRTAGRAAGSAGDGEDMLSLLHAARDPETGQSLSAAEIRDQVLVFLLAGHETTAGALTFTLHQLGLHPEIQDRVAGDETLARAALMEGMRLYPPAYGTERYAADDTEVAGRGIPAGTTLMMSPYVTHRHPEFWPDPERFDPDRFVGEHDRPRYAYFPFGGGPRSCIGEHFAMVEATVLLRVLLARYRVESLDRQVPLQVHITLRPADAVRARLHDR